MNKLDHVIAGLRALEPPPHVARPPLPQRHWEEAVGSRIARRTEPLRIERGVLHVRVATAAWANELSLLGEEIKRQLVARGIEVESLRFSVGRISRRQAHQRRDPVRQAPPPEPPLPAEIGERVAHIADEALARALALAAARSLAVRAIHEKDA